MSRMSNSISDKAVKCPHCGLPAEYFGAQSADSNKNNDIDYKSIANIIISFDKDYIDLFSDSHYISHREQDNMHSTYGEYYVSLKNKLIFQYVCNNASALRIDIDSLKRFLRKMHTLDECMVAHNEEYIEKDPYEFEITFSDLNWELEYPDKGGERHMGARYNYTAQWEASCPQCGSEVSATFTASEYPEFSLEGDVEILEGDIYLNSNQNDMNKLFESFLEDKMRADSCVDDF